MQTALISIENFSKKFGQHLVINDLSFEVKAEEIFAFLGANGSGKTTTIRCLLNIYEPTSGQLFINNQKFSHQMAQSIGYLPEERGLYLNSRVLETLIYFGRIKGLSKQQARLSALNYLKRVDLLDKVDSEINKLSSGQQQKIQLGLCIINQPQLLILDEPTIGLDPLNRQLLMDLLMELNEQGSTIMFVTHQMEEVEKIANRLVMIKDGRKELYGKVNEVKAQFGTQTLHLDYEGRFPRNNELYQARIEPSWAEITPNQGVDSDQIIRYLLTQDLKIEKFEVGLPSLQEVFLRVSQDH